jgi:hypothetical protein
MFLVLNAHPRMSVSLGAAEVSLAYVLRRPAQASDAASTRMRNQNATSGMASKCWEMLRHVHSEPDMVSEKAIRKRKPLLGTLYLLLTSAYDNANDRPGMT